MSDSGEDKVNVRIRVTERAIYENEVVMPRAKFDSLCVLLESSRHESDKAAEEIREYVSSNWTDADSLQIEWFEIVDRAAGGDK